MKFFKSVFLILIVTVLTIAVQAEKSTTSIIVSNKKPVDVNLIVSQPVVKGIAEEIYVYQPVIFGDHNETYKFRLEQAPEWMEIDPQSGRIIGKPQEKDIGLHGVILMVESSSGINDSQDFILQITAASAGVLSDNAAYSKRPYDRKAFDNIHEICGFVPALLKGDFASE